MKQLKKADTFVQKGEWQIDHDQLESVYNETKNADFSVYAEDVEETILALVRLGYIKLENNGGPK